MSKVIHSLQIKFHYLHRIIQDMDLVTEPVACIYPRVTLYKNVNLGDHSNLKVVKRGGTNFCRARVVLVS